MRFGEAQATGFLRKLGGRQLTAKYGIRFRLSQHGLIRDDDSSSRLNFIGSLGHLPAASLLMNP